MALHAQNLRERRLRKGLSQGQLGRAIGQSGTYISKLERGVLPVVTTHTLELLSRELDCSPEWLLDDEITRFGRPRAHAQATDKTLV